VDKFIREHSKKVTNPGILPSKEDSMKSQGIFSIRFPSNLNTPFGIAFLSITKLLLRHLIGPSRIDTKTWGVYVVCALFLGEKNRAIGYHA
jgi:hypothetical protein